jgi:Protein of unknown function (DUF295)
MYCLEDIDTNSCRTKLNEGIGDQMLFLDGYCNFCLKATDYDGFQSNCTYFSDLIIDYDYNNFTLKNHPAEYFTAKYKMEKGTTKLVPCPWDFGGT